jgi:hypothetical protein
LTYLFPNAPITFKKKKKKKKKKKSKKKEENAKQSGKPSP